MRAIKWIAVAMAALVVQASAEIVEEWNFTGDSLVGINGTAGGSFFTAGGNADVAGNDTWTLNRTQANSGNVITGLGLASNNTDKVTIAFTISSWLMTNNVPDAAGETLLGLRMRTAGDLMMGQLKFKRKNVGGTNQYMVIEGQKFNGSGNGQFINGGIVVNGNTGTNSIRVGLTMNFADNTYTFWLGDPATDDGTGWVNRYAAHTGALGEGFLTNALDNISFNWVKPAAGDFIEIDQLQVYTGDLEPEVPTAEEVIEEWNFPADTGSGYAKLKSENLVPAGFFAGGTGSLDTSTNDWFNVTRNSGNAGNISLTNYADVISAANTTQLVVSVTLHDFDFSTSSNQIFGINLKNGGSTVAQIKLDAKTESGGKTTVNGNVGGTFRNPGYAFDGVSSATPVTYGLTLDFTGGSDGKGSYAYWVGTPDSGADTWDTIWNGANRRTDDVDLSGVSIDALQWTISDHVAGDRFGLDQIKVYKVVEVVATNNPTPPTPPELFENWFTNYPSIGTSTNATENPDGDALNNLYEYALDGNPDDAGDQGNIPQYTMSGGMIEYVYYMRDDAEARGLSYSIGTKTDLVTDTVWTNLNITVVGTNTSTGISGFNAVTNQVSTETEDVQFIKLLIDGNF